MKKKDYLIQVKHLGVLFMLGESLKLMLKYSAIYLRP
jgi:hypothetical protein